MSAEEGREEKSPRRRQNPRSGMEEAVLYLKGTVVWPLSESMDRLEENVLVVCFLDDLWPTVCSAGRGMWVAGLRRQHTTSTGDYFFSGTLVLDRRDLHVWLGH